MCFFFTLCELLLPWGNSYSRSCIWMDLDRRRRVWWWERRKQERGGGEGGGKGGGTGTGKVDIAVARRCFMMMNWLLFKVRKQQRQWNSDLAKWRVLFQCFIKSIAEAFCSRQRQDKKKHEHLNAGRRKITIFVVFFFPQPPRNVGREREGKTPHTINNSGSVFLLLSGKTRNCRQAIFFGGGPMIFFPTIESRDDETKEDGVGNWAKLGRKMEIWKSHQLCFFFFFLVLPVVEFTTTPDQTVRRAGVRIVKKKT